MGGPQIALTARLTGAYPTDRYVLPEQWTDNQVTELGGDFSVRLPAVETSASSAIPALLAGFCVPNKPDLACFVDGFDVEVHGTCALD